MYFSFASKGKGSCNVSTCKFIRFPLNSYTFHALIRFFTAPILQETDDFPSFYTYLPLEQVTTLHIFAKKVIHFYKRLQTYEKNSDCLGHFTYHVYGKYFCPERHRPSYYGMEFMEHLSCKYQ